MYASEQISTEGYAFPDWASRCRHWLNEHDASKPRRKRRQREPAPLILTGQGLSIRVDKGRLIVRDGNTHFPSKRREFEFFKGSLDIPQRLVLLDGSGSITLDALDWLNEQGVTLIRLKWDGTFVTAVFSGGLVADPKKLAWQARARESQAEQLDFFIPLIRDKLANTLETLVGFLPTSKDRDRAETKIAAFLHAFETNPPNTLQTLLGIEAQAAAAYFQAWRAIELKWSNSKRYPIPDEWRTFFSRGSLAISNRGGANIRATHPVNALLNYAYAALLSQMKIQAIADGYDPTLGVVHKRQRSSFGPPRPGFAIDRMEPHRPVVDRAVLKLLREETFSGADFLLQSDGVVRLSPELARHLVSNLHDLFKWQQT